MTTPGPDLRQRVTAILRDHSVDYVGFQGADNSPDYCGEAAACHCGANLPEPQWAAHVAAVLIDELGLTQERGVRFKKAAEIIVLKGDAEYSDYGPHWQPLSRWVSAWVPEGQP